MLRKTLLIVALLLTSTHGANKKKEEKKYDENYLYLENAGLVVEFRPESEPKPLEPEFIYGANTGPRLIEFYAPWCPHVGFGRLSRHPGTIPDWRLM
jgi:hypothetical protein